MKTNLRYLTLALLLCTGCGGQPDQDLSHAGKAPALKTESKSDVSATQQALNPIENDEKEPVVVTVKFETAADAIAEFRGENWLAARQFLVDNPDESATQIVATLAAIANSSDPIQHVEITLELHSILVQHGKAVVPLLERIKSDAKQQRASIRWQNADATAANASQTWVSSRSLTYFISSLDQVIQSIKDPKRNDESSRSFQLRG